MNKLICGLLFSLPLSALSQETSAAWKPFEMIMGEWEGGGAGKPGQGTGGYSLKPDLNGKILVRRNHADYPAQPGQAQSGAHEDLMIIYPPQGQGPYRAEYFDSEGHVIHYAVSFPEGRIVFTSDGAASTMRFRLTYQKKPGGGLEIDFAMAPPNQDFRSYVSGTVTRKAGTSAAK
jgi:hypothetical protein